MCATQKNYSGAAEGKAILRERTEDTAEKLKIRQFVAAWSDETPNFVVLKIAKPPRKAKRGEVINGQPTNHGQYMIVEVEWGECKKGTRVDEYKFDHDHATLLEGDFIVHRKLSEEAHRSCLF